MNTRAIMSDRAYRMRKKYSGYKKLQLLYQNHIDSIFDESVKRIKLSEEESVEMDKIADSTYITNSIRESDKREMENIIKTVIENNVGFVGKIFLHHRFIHRHMNLIFNSKYQLFTRLKNICKKYAITIIDINMMKGLSFEDKKYFELRMNPVKFCRGAERINIWLDFSGSSLDDNGIFDPFMYKVIIKYSYALWKNKEEQNGYYSKVLPNGR